jgi:hypothetical protein
MCMGQCTDSTDDTVLSAEAATRHDAIIVGYKLWHSAVLGKQVDAPGGPVSAADRKRLPAAMQVRL